MGRYAPDSTSGLQPGIITQSAQMPISGVFGSGRVAVIPVSQSFIIPAEVIRVRLWAPGGNGHAPSGHAGGGSGFAMKVLSGLTIGAAVAASVGQTSGSTTSFGPYVSATSGKNGTETGPGDGGTGVGGDVNTTGGRGGYGTQSSGVYGGGGGAANLLGNGGQGGDSAGGAGRSAASGGGSAESSTVRGATAGTGLAPVGSTSLDHIGCGSGISSLGPVYASIQTANGFIHANAGNGGGGSGSTAGTFPGGGGGGQNQPGAAGYIIVEW